MRVPTPPATPTTRFTWWRSVWARGTRRALLALLILAVAVSLGVAASDDAAKPRSVYANEFPEGAGKGLADRWCGAMCHTPTLVTQQAKDSTGWEKTLTQMEKWGVTLEADQRDTLRVYLTERFGPRGR